MRTSSVIIIFLKVFAFVALMATFDGVSGTVFSYLRSHSKGGLTQKDYYVAKNCAADILVLGSSRAEHHYVPEILDSVGGLAYNGGTDGNGIVLGLGRYLMCSERHVPKILIYEITPEYDYLDNGEDNSRYLYYLRPYYERAGIRPIFEKVAPPHERLKMHSQMYRNSSKLIANVTDQYATDAENRGYVPVYGRMGGFDQAKKEYPALKIDSVKMGLLEQLVEETSKRGTELYLAISPHLAPERPEAMPPEYEPAAALARKYGLPLLDCSFVPNLSDKPELFDDANHLNDDGARKYTEMVAKWMTENK